MSDDFIEFVAATLVLFISAGLITTLFVGLIKLMIWVWTV